MFDGHIMRQVETSGSQVLKVTLYQTGFPLIIGCQGISRTVYFKGLMHICTISHHLNIICQKLLCQVQVRLSKCSQSLFYLLHYLVPFSLVHPHFQ